MVLPTPGLGSLTPSKPSKSGKIDYDRDDGEIKWGNPASKMAGRVEWFKLLLAHSDDLSMDVKGSEQFQRVARRLEELGKTPEEVVGEYMTMLWKHVMGTLANTIGGQTVSLSKFHIVITVPAIWNDAMKLKMQTACEASGMLDERPAGVGSTFLDFVDEPEAAAISTLLGYDGRGDIEVSL